MIGTIITLIICSIGLGAIVIYIKLNKKPKAPAENNLSGDKNRLVMDYDKQREMLMRLCRKDPSGQRRLELSEMLLNSAILSVIIYILVMVFGKNLGIAGWTIFGGLIPFIGIILYVSSRFIKDKAISGIPYSNVTYSTINLSSESLTYSYETDDDEYIYNIPKNEIQDFKIENGICTIIGKGMLNSLEKETFSFLMAYSKSDRECLEKYIYS